MKVVILDYGSGNVGSLSNMLKALGYEYKVSNKEEDIIGSSHLILPGVGAFDAVMKKISGNIPMNTLLEEVLTNKKPILGICVGMQVLADYGYENGKHEGLGLIHGEVKQIDTKAILPHVGWNDIQINAESDLFLDMEDISDFYFVHSYHFLPTDKASVLATTEYGDKRFVSVVRRDNIMGVQFHPEKSQDVGKLLVRNFVEYSS